MSAYTSTTAIHYKAGYVAPRLSQKRSSSKEQANKIDILLHSDALDIHSRSGQAIMNSPPSKIAPKVLLSSGVVRHCVTTQEKAIWHYLLRPGHFFFIWVFLGLLAALN